MIIVPINLSVCLLVIYGLRPAVRYKVVFLSAVSDNNINHDHTLIKTYLEEIENVRMASILQQNNS